jgi:hypothetical protein
MYMVSMLLRKALLVIVLHELQVLKKAEQSSVLHIALASQQQESLRHCFNMLMNSSEKTD